MRSTLDVSCTASQSFSYNFLLCSAVYESPAVFADWCKTCSNQLISVPVKSNSNLCFGSWFTVLLFSELKISANCLPVKKVLRALASVLSQALKIQLCAIGNWHNNQGCAQSENYNIIPNILKRLHYFYSFVLASCLKRYPSSVSLIKIEPSSAYLAIASVNACRSHSTSSTQSGFFPL